MVDPKTLKPGDVYLNSWGAPRTVTENDGVYIATLESGERTASLDNMDPSYWPKCRIVSRADQSAAKQPDDMGSVFASTSGAPGFGPEVFVPKNSSSGDDIVINAAGARQSRLAARYDLIPPDALHLVAAVLREGEEKYPDLNGIPNWKAIPVADHVNHLLAHVFNDLRAASVEELSHAACRCLFALQLRIEQDAAKTP